MGTTQENESRYRPGIEKLKTALGTSWPRIADWRVIPLGLVVDIADFYSVDPPKGTAEEQLRYIIDEAGLVDQNGSSIQFDDYHSSRVAEELARLIEESKSRLEHPTKISKKPKLADPSFRDGYAGNKFEAVNRISMLTESGPETLGPGSKERKSVLENLHRGLGLGDGKDQSKTELGATIAKNLDITWDTRCYSTGETITLEGLNRILVGASAALDSRRDSPNLSATEEAKMYAADILQQIFNESQNQAGAVHAVWNGRDAVTEMVRAKYPHARQTEWPGWYFEFKTLNSLIKRFGGGPHKVAGTEFDYRNVRTWDLKSHSENSPIAPLNDRAAIQQAVNAEGLGFIVLGGLPLFDQEEEFYAWHMEHIRGKVLHERSPKSRRLKTGFELRSLDFFFIANAEELRLLEERNILRNFRQGRQQDGSARKIKYNLDCSAARLEEVCVYSLNVADYVDRVNEEDGVSDSS